MIIFNWCLVPLWRSSSTHATVVSSGTLGELLPSPRFVFDQADTTVVQSRSTVGMSNIAGLGSHSTVNSFVPQCWCLFDFFLFLLVWSVRSSVSRNCLCVCECDFSWAPAFVVCFVLRASFVTLRFDFTTGRWRYCHTVVWNQIILGGNVLNRWNRNHMWNLLKLFSLFLSILKCPNCKKN